MTRRERTGVLVLHVWTETDQSDTLRARITSDSSDVPISVAGGSVDAVVELVRRWVESFVARQAVEGNPQ